jgi:hypothetical protein
MKTCTICKIEKDEEGFHFKRKDKLQRDTRCKECLKTYFKSYVLDSSIKRKTCTSCKVEHDISHFSKDKNNIGGYRPSCKTCARDSHLQRLYGINLREYTEFLEDQDHSCAICTIHLSEYSQRFKHFHVDHDHSTGEVRGLLCHNCNRALGMLQDDVVVLENAIKYLNK